MKVMLKVELGCRLVLKTLLRSELGLVCVAFVWPMAWPVCAAGEVEQWRGKAQGDAS